MITRIKIQSSTLAKLKLMADMHDLEIGACIESLLTLATFGFWLADDPAFQDRFSRLLETAIAHVKGGGWGSCHPLVRIKEDGTADLRLIEQWISDYEQAGKS